MFPRTHDTADSARVQAERARPPGLHQHGAFGEVLARYESYVDLDPETKDAGDPGPALPLPVSDNERKMAQDMSQRREMLEAAGIEVSGRTRKCSRRVVDHEWAPRHGQRSQDVVLNQFSSPTRPQLARGGRLEPRECIVSEPHVDDHGAGVALV